MTIAVLPPCDETAGQADAKTACPSQRGTLITTVLGSSLAFVMGSIVNVALPAMRTEFATDAAGVQWIVNAYLLPLSALVLVGGALGDHYGRKRFFMLGLWLFTGATIACVLSETLDVFLFARAVQGLGAALLAPNSLAIIADAFPGEERGKAVGTWAAAGAIAGAAAPVLGGWLVDTLDWRWAFAVVIPPAAAALWIGMRAIRESTQDQENAAPLDWTGAALATLALAGLVWALIAFPDRGVTDTAVLTVGGAGAAFAIAFLFVQKQKGTGAMMPLGMYASGSFSGLSLLTLFLYAGLGGLLVLLPYTLINDAGYSATAAGAAILPFPLIMGILSRNAGPLAIRFGIRRTLTAGPLMVAAGFTIMAIGMRDDFSYATGLLPGLVVMAIGMALTVAPLTTAVMNSVGKDYVGLASGVNNAISRTAGLIATALLGLVLVDGMGDSLIGGFRSAAWVGVALALAAAAASWAMIKEEDIAEDGASEDDANEAAA